MCAAVHPDLWRISLLDRADHGDRIGRSKRLCGHSPLCSDWRRASEVCRYFVPRNLWKSREARVKVGISTLFVSQRKKRNEKRK